MIFKKAVLKRISNFWEDTLFLERAKGFENFAVCKKDRANKGFLENCIETVLHFGSETSTKWSNEASAYLETNYINNLTVKVSTQFFIDQII